MQNNILAVPFRKGAHLMLSSAIRQYISTKYDQHPDMFRQDLDVIDVLRRDAINVREPHPTGVPRLQAYAGQLVWISGKFPIDVRPPLVHLGTSVSNSIPYVDRRRFHLVSRPGLQYRATHCT